VFLSHVICYSETNLKVKQALTVTAELGEDLQKLTEFNGESTWKNLLSRTFAQTPEAREHLGVFLPGWLLLPARTPLDAAAGKQNWDIAVCTTGINSTRKEIPPLVAGVPVLWWQPTGGYPPRTSVQEFV